jgi:Predicted transmembrane transcriptional regulator (anti-sigma factor)
MKCEEIRELLSLYIDKSLDENEMKAVEEHLSSCEDCSRECAELEEMIGVLGQTEMIPVPDAFNLRLKAALREEKQAMLENGILVKSNKKKHQWRIITSVAAVFAVGVLSFGLYHDVLGVLPDRFSGSEQSDTAQTGSENKVKIADDAAKADQPPENTGGSEEQFTASTEKKQLQMSMAKQPDTVGSDAAQSKKQAIDEEKYGKLNNEKANNVNMSAAATDAGATKEQASGGAAASSGTTDASSGTANQSAVADMAGSAPGTLSESEDSADAASGSDSNGVRYGAAAPNECSRSMTVPGIERNTAAVQFYNKLIEARLEGFDYQILDSSYTQAGEWRFRVFIFRGKDGNTYNEEITVIGKDGKINIVCSNKFTGLIN